MQDNYREGGFIRVLLRFLRAVVVETVEPATVQTLLRSFSTHHCVDTVASEQGHMCLQASATFLFHLAVYYMSLSNRQLEWVALETLHNILQNNLETFRELSSSDDDSFFAPIAPERSREDFGRALEAHYLKNQAFEELVSISLIGRMEGLVCPFRCLSDS